MDINGADEFLDFVDQAIYEMGDLVACAEDDSDTEGDFSNMLPVYQIILTELEKLHAAVQAGTNVPGDGQDLAFMTLVRKWKVRIPVAGTLEAINEIQKKGVA